MIFFFSGTGNSKWVAQQIASAQQERLISIGETITNQDADFKFTVEEKEKIGFVFPIHSWGPPPIVLEFIKRLNFRNYTGQYLFFVCTCGDDIGLTKYIIVNSLQEKGWNCYSGFSVIMPNNYILMTGFDVDSKIVEQNKLRNAVDRTDHINQLIGDRVNNIFDCTTGSFPWIKTKLIYPLFVRYQMSAKPFHATDRCTGCGLCEKNCPTRNINMSDKRPVWDKNCTMCLGCIHICPFKAIEYGNSTRKKGRYYFPVKS